MRLLVFRPKIYYIYIYNRILHIQVSYFKIIYIWDYGDYEIVP